MRLTTHDWTNFIYFCCAFVPYNPHYIAKKNSAGERVEGDSPRGGEMSSKVRQRGRAVQRQHPTLFPLPSGEGVRGTRRACFSCGANLSEIILCEKLKQHRRCGAVRIVVIVPCSAPDVVPHAVQQGLRCIRQSPWCTSEAVRRERSPKAASDLRLFRQHIPECLQHPVR